MEVIIQFTFYTYSYTQIPQLYNEMCGARGGGALGLMNAMHVNTFRYQSTSNATAET